MTETECQIMPTQLTAYQIALSSGERFVVVASSLDAAREYAECSFGEQLVSISRLGAVVIILEDLNGTVH